jgi:hypothetical protein
LIFVVAELFAQLIDFGCVVGSVHGHSVHYRNLVACGFRAVAPVKDREEWFSLRENHEKACRLGLHQLRNCSSR